MEHRTYEERTGVYIISVAARLLDMHPQTLRKYERAGFLTPSRTEGMLRLYSEEDIARLLLIKHLVEDLGLNLAGVELGLKLAKSLNRLRADVQETGSPEELRKRVAEGISEMMVLLGMGPAPGAAHRPARAVRIEIQAQD